jgi:hypothetical protein
MPLALASTQIIEDTMRQASSSHIFTSCQKWSQLVEENMWVVLLIHPLQRAGQILQAVCESTEQRRQPGLVVCCSSSDGIEH